MDQTPALEIDQSIHDTLNQWAIQELAFWKLHAIELTAAEQEWARLNERYPSLFLFRFEQGHVSISDKPSSLTLHPSNVDRAVKYLEFFRTVSLALPKDFCATIAMGMGDKLGFTSEVPVFCFQKRHGSTSILMPDIDFLLSDFHDGPSVNDDLLYEEKVNRAIFVGATTGGTITPHIARNCALPRLRAAKFFQDSEFVDFLLPKVIQCSNDEAAQILRDMPYCQHPRLNWQDQLTRRFIISMDGNGATCSRVAITLRSNSVLLKYKSEEVLYYFHGLQEWKHYIPINSDYEVERIAAIDSWSPGLMKKIAEDGKKFARSYLNRFAITAYTVNLLLLYQTLFAVSWGATPPGNSSKLPQTYLDLETPSAFRLVAHVQALGDKKSDSNGWAGIRKGFQALEGFLIFSDDPGLHSNLRYTATFGDGTVTPPTPFGSFCGTRGKNRPIFGFGLESTSPDQYPYIAYEGEFLDGTRVGPLRIGQACVSATRSPLVAMRVMTLSA